MLSRSVLSRSVLSRSVLPGSFCALACMVVASPLWAEDEPPAEASAPSAEQSPPAPYAEGAEGQPRRVLRIAVYDVDGGGKLDPAVGRIVGEALAAELRKLERVDVVGMQEIRDMLDLEAEKAMLGCDEEESCLAEIADALGVDELVTATAARVGTESVFGVRRIDQRQARVAGTYEQRLTSAGGEEFLAAVGPAVEELYGDRPLKPGAERGVSDRLSLRLNPPPLPPWVFWTTGAASAAFAVTTLASVGWWGLAMGSYLDLSQRSVNTVQSGQALKLLESQLLYASIAFYGSLALGLLSASTTGVLYFFTDFEGVGDEGD